MSEVLTDEKSRSCFEALSPELVLIVFSHFSCEQLMFSFFGLNSYFNSIIHSLSAISHSIQKDESNAVNTLRHHANEIHRLVVVDSPTTCLIPLINLRSLTLKYGTPEQFNSIRPDYFPMLEILHIYSEFPLEASNTQNPKAKLLERIFSNGFPKLRIFTSIYIGAILSNETWTHAPNLRCVHLYLKENKDYEQLLSICSNLRRFTTYEHPVFYPWLENFQGNRRRILAEIERLRKLEYGGKFMLHECSFDKMTKQSVPARFDKTDVSPPVVCDNTAVIRGRIFPSKYPYCLASFLIEIKLKTEFPFIAPEVSLLDPIYHPDVKGGTKICVCSLRLPDDIWTPTTHLKYATKRVIELIDSEPIDGQWHNLDIGYEYHSARDTFEQKALNLVLSKGRPREYR